MFPAKTLEIKAEGNGGISFLKKGVQGKLYFSKKDARGVVHSLQGEVQRDNLQEQRECMQPYVDRVLDAILGDQGATSSNNRQLPKGFSIDDKGFVVRAEASGYAKLSTTTIRRLFITATESLAR